MNRTIISLCLFLMVSFSLFSQKIYVGPEIGLNVINVETQDIGNDFQPTINAGLAFEYRMNDWFSIGSGAYFTQKRQGYTRQDTSAFEFFGIPDSMLNIPGIDMNTYTSTEGRVCQRYIQIPLTTTFRWNGLRLNLGGYAGIMFSARRRESSVSTTPFMSTMDLGALGGGGFLSELFPEPYEESYTESSDKTNLRSFDYGIHVGLEYQVDNFGVQCSYWYGIPDYREDNGGGEINRHKYLQFGVKYLFGIGSSGGKSSID